MPKRIDLAGQRFGRLTVTSFAGTDKNGKALWHCQCECGNKTIVLASNLKRKTRSCGCLRQELSSERITNRNNKHGESRTRLYAIWGGIKERTKNPNNCNYDKYGKKGIKMCADWEDYENFKTWALASGYANNLSIDRKDNTKGYSPENCRWVTLQEQNRNTTRNAIFLYKGERKTLCEWAEIAGINYQTLSARIHKLGWNIEKALETPVKKKKDCT